MQNLLKKCSKKTRRFVTLVEMMVVIFIIGLIVSVVGFRYQGSLEKGKAFKTETSIDKVETFLSLRVAENPHLIDNIERGWQEIIRTDPFAKDPEALIRDGWGEPLQVEVNDQGRIHVWSRNLDNYKKNSK